MKVRLLVAVVIAAVAVGTAPVAAQQEQYRSGEWIPFGKRVTLYRVGSRGQTEVFSFTVIHNARWGNTQVVTYRNSVPLKDVTPWASAGYIYYARTGEGWLVSHPDPEVSIFLDMGLEPQFKYYASNGWY